MGDVRLAPLTDVDLLSVGELVALGVDEFVLATLPDGQPEGFPAEQDEFLVFAYSSAHNLVTACGPGQPARAATTSAIARSAARAGSRVRFALDVWHPAGHRYPAPDPLDFEPAEYAERVESVTELWLPIRPVRTGAPTVHVELFEVTPGQPVLLAYESPEELRACCGPFQAAVSIDRADLASVIASTGASGVLLGAVLSADARPQAPVLDWTTHDPFELDVRPPECPTGPDR